MDVETHSLKRFACAGVGLLTARLVDFLVHPRDEAADECGEDRAENDQHGDHLDQGEALVAP